MTTWIKFMGRIELPVRFEISKIQCSFTHFLCIIHLEDILNPKSEI